MFRNPSIAVAMVTAYLLLYYILFLLNVSLTVLFIMFVFSPFLVAWMLVIILKDRKYAGKELKENEEWGYADREKSTLKTF